VAEHVRRDEIYLSLDQLFDRVRVRANELLEQRARFDHGDLDVRGAAESLDDDACEMGGQCSNSPVVIEKAIDVAAKALLIVFYQGDEDEEQLDLPGEEPA